jgi:hypothetical protein
MTESAANQPAAGTADLIGYGRLTWDQLLATVGSAQAAWADYEGFHINQAPPEPPPYTHLWAWTSQWLIRARIDGDTAVTAALVLTAPPQAAPAAKLHQQVSYQRAQTETWRQGEQRVGPLESGIAGRPVVLYLIAGTRPITFVSLTQV